MNIQRAKDEIKKSVQAYLSKTAQGEYAIPTVRQRPIYLLGPPGIGKTAIMEQVAIECGVALVSYSITHHTIQSMVGVPFVEKMYYKKEPYSVTQYTLSEIIAAIYNKISLSGVEEGILFIDEINCVSESISPSLLQFLQGKTFGNNKIPDGWVIVVAGNPPKYSDSVREFDIVTLDRLKRIELDADYEAWRLYALKYGIHGAINAYLGLKPDNFYDVTITESDKLFATARGWEDLSVMLKEYEKLGYDIDVDFILEYIQHPRIAADFSAFYRQYKSLETELRVDEILKGFGDSSLAYIVSGKDQETRYILVSQLVSRLNAMFSEVDLEEKYIFNIDGILKKTMGIYETSRDSIRGDAGKVTDELEVVLTKKIAANMIAGNDLAAARGAIRYVSEATLKYGCGSEYTPINEDAFAGLRQDFARVTKIKDDLIVNTGVSLNSAFSFLQKALGSGKEMDLFVKMLRDSHYAMEYIHKFGNDYFSKYSPEV